MPKKEATPVEIFCEAGFKQATLSLLRVPGVAKVRVDPDAGDDTQSYVVERTSGPIVIVEYAIPDTGFPDPISFGMYLMTVPVQENERGIPDPSWYQYLIRRDIRIFPEIVLQYQNFSVGSDIFASYSVWQSFSPEDIANETFVDKFRSAAHVFDIIHGRYFAPPVYISPTPTRLC